MSQGGYEPISDDLLIPGMSTNMLNQAQSAADQPRYVFMGWGRGPKPQSYAGDSTPRGFGTEMESTRKGPRLPRLATVDEALVAFETQDREQFDEWRKLLVAAGYIPADADFLTVRDGFEDLLGDVERLTALGEQIPPKEYLRTIAQMNGTDPDKLDEDEVEKKTTIQRNVSELSEGEAWSMLQSNLSQMLGRDPSDQEVRDFTYRMNGLATTNPSISKTVTRYKNGEAVSSNTTTDPGFTAADATMAAYNEAQNDPEYAEYQSATTYFNAALSALGPIGG